VGTDVFDGKELTPHVEHGNRRLVDPFPTSRNEL
jgi:hypothetical protein